MTDFKIGDKYKLECSHDGRIVWKNENDNKIGVAGVRRLCRNCGKNTSGNWTSTVYLIQLDNEKGEQSN